MGWQYDDYILHWYGLGFLALLAASVYGMVALASCVRGEPLFMGALEVSPRAAFILGLLLQLPIIGYVILGYNTGALVVLWQAVRLAPW